jgi:hypothetical protein
MSKRIRVEVEELTLEQAHRLRQVLHDRGYSLTVEQSLMLYFRVLRGSEWKGIATWSDDNIFKYAGRLFTVVGEAPETTNVCEAEHPPCPTCGTPYGGWCECGF